jgi:hypothetical protein
MALAASAVAGASFNISITFGEKLVLYNEI